MRFDKPNQFLTPLLHPRRAHFNDELQVDFFERLSAMGVKAIVASQLAAAPLPISTATVANSSKEVEGTTLPLDTNIVPSIEEIYR